MATVPYSPSTPQQTVAPAPVGITPGSAAGATPDAFSPTATPEAAQAAQNIKNIGDQMAMAADRVQTQNDVVARAKDISAYHATVTDEARRISTESDLSDPKTVSDFAKFTTDQLQKTIDNHAGSAQSRAMLMPSLESSRSSTLDTVAAGSFAAKKAVVGTFMDSELNKNVAAVIEQPGTLVDRLAAWKSRVTEMTPAVGTTKAAEWQQHGDEEITRSVVQSFIDKGQYDDAKKIMATPGIDTVLGGDVQRSLNAKMIAGQQAKYKDEHAGELAIQKAQQILGPDVKITPPMRLQLAGLNPTGAQSLPEKISQMTDAMKKVDPNFVMTPDMISRLAGAGGPEASPFGDKDLGVMVNLQPKMSDGSATPQEKIMFEAAANNYTQPKFDEQTGTTIPGKTLPPSIKDAMDKSGIKISTGVTPPTPSPQAAAQAAVDPNTSMDIFGSAKNFVGIGPSIARGAAGLPIVGKFVPSPQAVQTQEVAQQMERSLITTLSDNPRIRQTGGVKERAEMAKEINVAADMGQPTENWENKVVGLDGYLAKQLNAAMAAMQPGHSREEQLWGQRASAQIADFRFHLNAPPVVKSANDYAKFVSTHAKGSAYVDPNGIIRHTTAGVAQ